jgi:hypothetical protein
MIYVTIWWWRTLGGVLGTVSVTPWGRVLFHSGLSLSLLQVFLRNLCIRFYSVPYVLHILAHPPGFCHKLTRCSSCSSVFILNIWEWWKYDRLCWRHRKESRWWWGYVTRGSFPLFLLFYSPPVPADLGQPDQNSCRWWSLSHDRHYHVTKKRKQIDLKTKELNWLIGGRSNLSLENKVRSIRQ